MKSLHKLCKYVSYDTLENWLQLWVRPCCVFPSYGHQQNRPMAQMKLRGKYRPWVWYFSLLLNVIPRRIWKQSHLKYDPNTWQLPLKRVQIWLLLPTHSLIEVSTKLLKQKGEREASALLLHHSINKSWP